ncbi:MAG TPA: ABC-2 family transporter protein [Polyangiaceae bacterium]|nr:ABC-2 family transporter protein [Polyangiaceae bacterium]
MLGALTLYGKLVHHSLRAQLEYRASFWLKALGLLLVSGADFAFLWALFRRFGSLGGFSLAEVAVLYGIVNAGIAIADAMGRGLDTFGALVKSGDFDRVLLRPRSPLLLLIGQELTLRRLARLSQAWLALAWGLSELRRPLDADTLAVLIAAHIAAALVFLSIWILQATLCFFTVESLEVMNIFSYGGAQVGQQPLSIYAPWLRRTFTAVVPVGTVVYYPGLLVLGRHDPLGGPAWLGYVAPLAGPAFFVVAVLTFGWGVRRYTSTGS